MQHYDFTLGQNVEDRILFPDSFSYTYPMKYITKKELEKGSNDLPKQIVIGSGIYKGYKWVIVSRLTHPCAYIVTHINDICYKNPCPGLNVHGGVTYSQFGLQDLVDDTEWVVGWDYAHGFDYNVLTEEGDKYATLDIYYEVLQAINQIINE